MRETTVARLTCSGLFPTNLETARYDEGIAGSTSWFWLHRTNAVQSAERQILTVPSWQHEASEWASCENASALIAALWPSRLTKSWPVKGSQSRTRPAVPPVARTRPSGENARLCRGPIRCAGGGCSRRSVFPRGGSCRVHPSQPGSPVGRKPDGGYLDGMGKHPMKCPGRHLPEAYGPVVTHRGEQFPVRTERNLPHLAGAPLQDPY